MGIPLLLSWILFHFLIVPSLDLDKGDMDPKEIFNYMPHDRKQVTMKHFINIC